MGDCPGFPGSPSVIINVPIIRKQRVRVREEDVIMKEVLVMQPQPRKAGS